jgi:hypothetical protein
VVSQPSEAEKTNGLLERGASLLHFDHGWFRDGLAELISP